MPTKHSLLTAMLAILCAVSAACAALAEPSHTSGAPVSTPPAITSEPTPPPSPSPTATVQPPSPSPPPTEKPTPTLTPSPTPSPSPTATPDLWAEHFTKGGAWVTVPNQDKGPWIYKDETLSIQIDMLKFNSRTYFRAEIWSRGPLPFGGFAYNDPKGKKRALPYLIARQNKAILGITGDYVTHNGNPKGIMIREGRIYHDKKAAPTLAVMPDGELKVYEPGEITATKLLKLGVKDSFAFGPILVKDGKVHKSVAGHRLNTHNWRASIGMVEKGHYIIIVNPVGISLTDLAKLYVKNKCTVAYNLDGGHSSTIVFMGEQLYKQAPGEDNGEQRSLPDLLMIGTSGAVPAPNAPVYCNGLGYNKKYRPKPTDGPLK